MVVYLFLLGFHLEKDLVRFQTPLRLFMEVTDIFQLFACILLTGKYSRKELCQADDLGQGKFLQAFFPGLLYAIERIKVMQMDPVQQLHAERSEVKAL